MSARQVFRFSLLLPLPWLLSPGCLGGVTWDLSGDFDGNITGVPLEGGFVSWAKFHKLDTTRVLQVQRPKVPNQGDLQVF